MKIKPTSITVITLFALGLNVTACGEKSPPQGNPATGSGAAETQGQALTLNGAGATFPYPVYAQWAHTYHKVTGTKLNYQSIGSGGGIAQIKAKTVDFGASDAPLKAEELNSLGLIQFPLVMGGVIPVINVAGIEAGQLKLTRTLLADIFLGKIKKWNHTAIKAVNPELELPDREIAVVHRADGSGTTWIFTNYLNKISPEWKEKVGTGKAVSWPIGMGGKGNEGVAAYVQRISGSIGYVEFAYALQNKMSHVLLENRTGTFVEPTVKSFQAAAANGDWANAPGFYLVLTDQPGDGSWPITGASFILIYKEQANKDIAQEMLSFFKWCYDKGAQKAINLHYVPMPPEVVSLVETQWKRSLASAGEPLWP